MTTEQVKERLRRFCIRNGVIASVQVMPSGKGGLRLLLSNEEWFKFEHLSVIGPLPQTFEFLGVLVLAREPVAHEL